MAYTQRVGKKHRGVYRDRNGRKVYSQLVSSRPAALAWAVQQEQKVRAGMDPAAGSMPLREWADLWRQTRVVERTTAASDETRVEAVVQEWGDWSIDTIRTSAVQGWVKRLCRDMAAGTAIKYLNVLSSMMTAAVRDGLRPDNPCRHVRRPVVPKGNEVYLTRDEVDRLVAAAPPPYDDVIYVLAYTGLRWGELAGLPAKHVDLMRGRLHVRQTLIEIAGERSIKPYPKSRRASRTVPLTDEVVAVLSRHMATPTPDGLVFHGRTGAPLSRHHFPRTFKAAERLAGVREDARPHDLRHTYASWLVQGGVELYRVQALLGHESFETTQRYSHLMPDQFDAPLAVLRRDVTEGLEGRRPARS